MKRKAEELLDPRSPQELVFSSSITIVIAKRLAIEDLVSFLTFIKNPFKKIKLQRNGPLFRYEDVFDVMIDEATRKEYYGKLMAEGGIPYVPK